MQPPNPFFVLLWDLAQSQGCFWRSNPWFCSLKGSFISHRGSFFPRPSFLFALPAQCLRVSDGPLKTPFFPMVHFSFSLPVCFSFPGGTSSMAVCTDDLCDHQHPSKWIYSPPILPGCSATPSCPSSQTGLSEVLSPSADATGAAGSGETRHFNVWGGRPQKSALSERPWSPLEETMECRWWTNVRVYRQSHIVNQNRKAVQPFGNQQTWSTHMLMQTDG